MLNDESYEQTVSLKTIRKWVPFMQKQ